MRANAKALWNGIEVLVIGVEYRSSFGDLIKIRCEDKEKIVNSNYIELIECKEGV